MRDPIGEETHKYRAERARDFNFLIHDAAYMFHKSFMEEAG